MAFDAKYNICVEPVSPDGASSWVYRGTDALLTVAAAGFIINPEARIGDNYTVTVVDNQADPTAATASGDYYVSAVNATTGGLTLTART